MYILITISITVLVAIIVIILLFNYCDTPTRRHRMASKIRNLSVQFCQDYSSEAFLKIVHYALKSNDHFVNSYAIYELAEISNNIDFASHYNTLIVSILTFQTRSSDSFIRYAAASAMLRLRNDVLKDRINGPIKKELETSAKIYKDELTATLIQRLYHA